MPNSNILKTNDDDNDDNDTVNNLVNITDRLDLPT